MSNHKKVDYNQATSLWKQIKTELEMNAQEKLKQISDNSKSKLTESRSSFFNRDIISQGKDVENQHSYELS